MLTRSYVNGFGKTKYENPTYTGLKSSKSPKDDSSHFHEHSCATWML